jgi:hypothetical protein
VASFLRTEVTFVWAVEVLVLFSSQNNIWCDFLRPAHFAFSFLPHIEALCPRSGQRKHRCALFSLFLCRWCLWSVYGPAPNDRWNNKMHKTVPVLSLPSVPCMQTWRARVWLPLKKCSRVRKKTRHVSCVWWGLRPLCLRMPLIGECPVLKVLPLGVNDPTATYVVWKSAASFRRKDFAISV